MRIGPLILILLLPASTALGQRTNAQVMGDLAVQCISAPLDSVAAFRLQVPATHPYLGQAISEWAAASQREVYTPESADLLLTRLSAVSTGVLYARAGRRNVDRAVAFSARLLVTATDGRVIRDEACTRRSTDQIPRSSLPAVENTAWPETVGERPPAGWASRALHPVVVTGASAVATYLFFSLRSRRSDDG